MNVTCGHWFIAKRAAAATPAAAAAAAPARRDPRGSPVSMSV